MQWTEKWLIESRVRDLKLTIHYHELILDCRISTFSHFSLTRHRTIDILGFAYGMPIPLRSSSKAH